MLIRPAGPADSQALFDWRNDPDTRAASGSRDEVDRESHEAWFTASLASPSRTIYLAELDGRAVGMCRFDERGGGGAEVSINLDPECRGRGLARAVLSGGMEAYRAEHPGPVVARIRPDNSASVRLFLGAGFALTHSDPDFDWFEA